MKIKGAEKVHYDSGPNMTPLVDVVMVILIFLMLTGTFAAGEHFLVSTSSLKGKSSQPKSDKPLITPDETNLEIRVDSFSRPGPDGGPQDIWSASAGRVRVENNRDQLTSQLNKMREDFATAMTPVDKIQVVINP